MTHYLHLQHPKFYRQNGTLTAYAFACGYVEQTDIDNNNRLTLLMEHGSYSVRGFVKGNHIFEGFRTLGQARKFYKEQVKAFSTSLPENP
jgi:hypothetical protein